MNFAIIITMTSEVKHEAYYFFREIMQVPNNQFEMNFERPFLLNELLKNSLCTYLQD